MVAGILSFIFVSLLLSAVTTLTAAAFGAGTISDLSNQARQTNGLASYTVNSALSAAAQAKANHMVSNGYFDHTAPDGTTGWYFVDQQGYSYTTLGENLAASNEDDVAVVDGWMNSPGHRANLLSSTFTEVGYGIAYQGEFQGYQNVTFIVALYAKPKYAAPPPAAAVQQPPATPSESSVQDQPPASNPETPPSPAVVEEDPSPVSETADLVTSQPLSADGFRLNQNLLVITLAVSGVLFGVGFGVELFRLRKHLTHARTHRPHHHHA